MSLISQLEMYLKADGDWVNSGALERMEWKHANGKLHKPSIVGRRLRELAEQKDSPLETRQEGKSVDYRHKTPTSPKMASQTRVEPRIEIRDGRRVMVSEYCDLCGSSRGVHESPLWPHEFESKS